MPDRHAGLARAAARRHDDAHGRAVEAIRRLDRAGEPISFKAVAAAAGVSRQWLYTQPDLRQDIERLRTNGPGPRRECPPLSEPARSRCVSDSNSSWTRTAGYGPTSPRSTPNWRSPTAAIAAVAAEHLRAHTLVNQLAGAALSRRRARWRGFSRRYR